MSAKNIKGRPKGKTESEVHSTRQEELTMTRRSLNTVCAAAALVALMPLAMTAQRPIAPPIRTTASSPAYQRFLSPASPLELVAARRADRIAWTSFEEGKRNAFTAAAPSFTPVRLTNFTTDNGVDLSGIRISDDGSTVIFARGTAANRDGWVANPTADPDGPERAIWAARTSGGGAAWRVVRDAVNPELAPDGSAIVFVKDGQIYRARVVPARAATEHGPRGEAVHHPMGRSERTEVVAGRPQDRVRQHAHRPQLHHGVRRRDADREVPRAERRLRYEPALDERQQERRVRPPPRSAVRLAIAAGNRRHRRSERSRIPEQRGPWRRRTRWARSGGSQTPAAPNAQQTGDAQPQERVANLPGLMQATFKGGYTLSVWRGDAATGEAVEVWHNQPNDRMFTNFANLRLAGHHLIVPYNVGGGGRGGRGRGAQPPAELTAPVDEWERYYSIDLSTTNAKPVLLTTTDGLIEDQTSVALSADQKTLYYCTNAKDIERRHIWAVPVVRRRAAPGHERRGHRDVSRTARVRHARSRP